MHKPGPNPDDLAEFTALLAGAKKPVVIAGPGVWYSHSEGVVGDFCAARDIPIFQPVTHVKSFLPGHPVNMGLVDYHQNPCSRMIGAESDLVMLLGGRLDFPLDFGEAPLFRTETRQSWSTRQPANCQRDERYADLQRRAMFQALARKGRCLWCQGLDGSSRRDARRATPSFVLAEANGPISAAPMHRCADVARRR